MASRWSALDDSPPVHFCKPAVDIMFSSAAEVWGGWVLGVVLTGMGSDGLNGANDIVAAGGAIIAQDEATSVVWGMPGSVAEAGLCSRCCRSPRSRRRCRGCFWGGGRDPIRFRFHPQASEDSAPA